MKRLIFALFVLSACSKDPGMMDGVSVKHCGYVVGKRIVSNGPHDAYFIKISSDGRVYEQRVTESIYANAHNGETKCFN